MMVEHAGSFLPESIGRVCTGEHILYIPIFVRRKTDKILLKPCIEEVITAKAGPPIPY